MNNEVFITGREGFVGTWLDKELKNHGYFTSGTSLHEYPNGEAENIFQCDITDSVQVQKIISERQPKYIFHLAALANPRDAINNPELALKINVEGTRNVFEAIRAIPNYRPRTIVIGSSEEFGVIPAGVIVTEETPLASTNPYGISKVKAWQLAQEYIDKFNFDIVSAIPFNHTGPGQLSGMLAPDIVSQVVEIERGLKKPILITGNVSHKRNFSDVRDVVRAYRMLMTKAKTGERYVVCADNSVSMSYLVETLIGLSTVKIEHQIDPNRARPSDTADIMASHAKITKELGWQPEIPIEQTLRDLLDWYRTKR